MTNKINNLIKTIFLMVSIIAISTVNSCSLKSGKDKYITIGALLPLTGDSSDEGFRASNGLQLAKEEINENGGVLGKKLDFIILNDKGDEEYIVKQYNILKRKGVAAIIGSSYSDTTIALAKAAEKDGIPIISPTASNPEVTKGRKNVFRAVFIDDYQAEVMAYFAYNLLKARTALILSNKSYDSFRQTSDVFANFFKLHGGQIIATHSYPDGDSFKNILYRYMENPPDIIFCPENYIPAARLVNAVHDLGFRNTNILGTDAWDGILTYVFNSDAMKNAYYSAPFLFDDQDAEVAQFVRNYFTSFSQMPLSGAAAAYSCVYILAEAMEKAGNTNKDDIISAIKANELETIMGNIKYDENNNPRTNAYVIQIKNGNYSTFKKIHL